MQTFAKKKKIQTTGFSGSTESTKLYALWIFVVCPELKMNVMKQKHDI